MMYYHEQMIDGHWFYQTTPNGEWYPGRLSANPRRVLMSDANSVVVPREATQAMLDSYQFDPTVPCDREARVKAMWHHMIAAAPAPLGVEGEGLDAQLSKLVAYYMGCYGTEPDDSEIIEYLRGKAEAFDEARTMLREALHQRSPSAGVRGDAIPRVVLELPDGDNRQAKVRWTEWKSNELHVCLTVTTPPTGLSAEEVEALEACEGEGTNHPDDVATICAGVLPC